MEKGVVSCCRKMMMCVVTAIVPGGRWAEMLSDRCSMRIGDLCIKHQEIW